MVRLTPNSSPKLSHAVPQHNQLQGRLNASRRAEALALAEGQRVDLGALRQYRREHVATMAPE